MWKPKFNSVTIESYNRVWILFEINPRFSPILNRKFNY